MMLREGFGGIFGRRHLPLMVNRMHARHAMLVDAFRHAVADASVLQLGAGDGHWCYAYAAAGALQVVGVEPSAELVHGFGQQPDVGLRERIALRCSNPLDEVGADADAGCRYDVIAVFDSLGGSDPAGLLAGLARLHPQLVIIDDLFADSANNRRRAVSPQAAEAMDVAGLDRTIAGAAALPQRRTLEGAAQLTGFELNWLDWRAIPADARIGLDDYFENGPVRRASAALIPRTG